ncbi:MAG TPA: flavodoxin, partial [Halomonas sp.]|nr:flavodoxin [Halomonas sp.]
MKRLLIVAHSPSVNTQALCRAVHHGAEHEDIEAVECIVKTPFEAGPADILACDGIVLGTTENLGYMSGA